MWPALAESTLAARPVEAVRANGIFFDLRSSQTLLTSVVLPVPAEPLRIKTASLLLRNVLRAFKAADCEALRVRVGAADIIGEFSKTGKRRSGRWRFWNRRDL